MGRLLGFASSSAGLQIYGWYNLEAHNGRIVATNNNSCGSTTRACIYVFN